MKKVLFVVSAFLFSSLSSCCLFERDGDKGSGFDFAGDGECVVENDPEDFPALAIVYSTEETGSSFAFSVLPDPLISDDPLAVVEAGGAPRELTGKTFFQASGFDGNDTTPVTIAFVSDSADPLEVSHPADTTHASEFVTMNTTVVKSGSDVDHVVVHIQRAGEGAKIEFRRFP